MMKCQNCGTDNKEGAVFCANCGAKIEAPVVQEPVAAEQTKSHKNIFVICGIVVALVVIGVAGLLVWQQTQSGKLKLDEETIRDATVRTTFSAQFDTDGDGVLSKEELANAETIDVSGVTDASWLPYFTNCKTCKIANSEVGEVNFYENRSLTSIDVSGANNLEKITFPDSGEFIDITLPDREGIETVFPPTSKMELQHVPVKVQTPSVTYNQEVESVIKVTKLDKQGEQTTYSYNNHVLSSTYETQMNKKYKSVLKRDDSGRIVQDVNNFSSGKSTKYTAEYDASGNVTAVGVDLANKVTYTDNSIVVSYNNGESNSVIKSWVLNSEKKPTRFFSHIGNGMDYRMIDYTWEDGKLAAEKISFYQQTSDSTNVDDMKLSESFDVNFTYDENGRLVKSEFSNGCVQSFGYENDVLTSVTTSGAPESGTYVLTLPKNGKTEIKYKSFVGLKGRTPLSFINLPGVAASGLVNLDVSEKMMSFYESLDVMSGNDDSFTGKFWWDAEDIEGYQKEWATLKNLPTEQVVAEEDPVDVVAEKKEEWQRQGYSVYEGTLKVGTSYSGNSLYYIEFDEESEISYAATMLGSDNRGKVSKVALSSTSGIAKQISPETKVLLVANSVDGFMLERGALQPDYTLKDGTIMVKLNQGFAINLDTMEEVKGS